MSPPAQKQAEALRRSTWRGRRSAPSLPVRVVQETSGGYQETIPAGQEIISVSQETTSVSQETISLVTEIIPAGQETAG